MLLRQLKVIYPQLQMRAERLNYTLRRLLQGMAQLTTLTVFGWSIRKQRKIKVCYCFIKTRQVIKIKNI